MIKFFENGDKEHLKRVLRKVYKCENVEQMSDDELVFCYIAKTLDSLGNFCEIAESAEIDLGYRVKKLENRVKRLEKRLEKKAKIGGSR